MHIRSAVSYLEPLRYTLHLIPSTLLETEASFFIRVIQFTALSISINLHMHDVDLVIEFIVHDSIAISSLLTDVTF